MPRRILLVCVLCALALPALATTSRVRSLGAQADYFEDDSNVFRWYGSLVDYPQLAVLELGEWNHDTSGDLDDRVTGSGGAVHFRFDEQGRWGTAAMAFGDDMPEPDPGGWIRLVWARRFGPVSLGATFRGTSYSSASNGPNQALDGNSRFLHNLGLGARVDLSDAVYLDLAAEIQDSEVDFYDRANNVAIEDDGGWDSFGVRGRVFHALTDHAAAVYRLAWFRDIRPIVDAELDHLAYLDGDLFHGGVGFNLLLDADNLVLLAADSTRPEADRPARWPIYANWDTARREWWQLDVRVAVESRLRSWLTLRGAASYRRSTDESNLVDGWSGDYVEQAYFYDVGVDTPVSLGLGLHFGQFDADFLFNATAPFSLGNALVGGEGDDASFSSITLSYGF